MVILCIGVPSTWFVLGIWKQHTDSYRNLTTFIAKNGIRGPVGIYWSPDVYRAWPSFERSLGFRLGDNLALSWAVKYQVDGKAAYKQPLVVWQTTGNGAAKIRFETGTGWSLVEAK